MFVSIFNAVSNVKEIVPERYGNEWVIVIGNFAVSTRSSLKECINLLKLIEEKLIESDGTSDGHEVALILTTEMSSVQWIGNTAKVLAGKDNPDWVKLTRVYGNSLSQLVALGELTW